MNRLWRTIKVFISSTFRDMQAERDHLVRVVFPELKERCRQRHIQLIDVDLRWGVSKAEAEGGGALDICLDEIDSCRPYFLGLLGYRYGTVPSDQKHSITAQEIYHGVLHNSLPRQIVDLRPFVEGILEGRTLFKEQVSCLVRNYQWDAEKKKYLLQPKVISEDQKTLHSIFDAYSIYQKDRSFFFFRSEPLSKQLQESSNSAAKDFFEVDQAFREKLEKLKQEIKEADLPCFEYENLESFGQNVLETLWTRIDAEFPEKREELERDWVKEETELHELFMADRTRRFVGRSDILLRMHNFVEEDNDPRLMVVTGESGGGKSALMARFTEKIIQSHPDWLILSHFVGASASSTNLRQTLKRLCTQLNRSLGITEEVPEEYKELAQLFPELLQKASQNRQILLVIDALNQLEKTDFAHSMRWLPPKLPHNVKVVVSTLAGEVLDALKAWSTQSLFEEVGGLTEPEIEEFVTGYLEEIRKKFPTPEIRDAFYKKIKAGNPLYILVALEELRVFPVYEEVGKRVASLPATIPELFKQVLVRVEGDFTRPLVKDFLSLIACGKQGMTGDELQTLLKKHAAVADSGKLPDMLFARLKRAFSAYLFERSGVIDFFHTQLKEAVGKRYLLKEVDRDKTHKKIAEYFEKRWAEPYLRALDELPHQLTRAKDWDGLERILCDLKFIEAKCAAGMTYDLVHDYNNTLDALPEAQPEKQERLKHEARLKKYTEDLIAYAKGEIKHLDIIPSVEPWSDEKIRQDTERIINNPTRLDRIETFSQFVNSESHSFVKFAVHPGFVLQQAYNSANSGPVAKMAENMINVNSHDVTLIRQRIQRPQYNPYPCLVRLIEGPLGYLDLTSDRKEAVCFDGSTWSMWDLENAMCLKRLESHPKIKYCNKIRLASRRKIAVSIEENHTLRVWDLEKGECIRVLEGHAESVNDLCITPEGRIAVSVSGSAFSSARDRTVRVWNLETGECEKILEGHSDIVRCVDITPDGKIAVSGGADKVVKVWDIINGVCIMTCEGHQSWVEKVCITPDGKVAVSASQDKTIRVWDVNSGKCLKLLEGHIQELFHLGITPDAKLAVSAGHDDTIRVWDLIGGKCINTIQRRTYDTNNIFITPDGATAVSLSLNDGNLRVWNIKNSYNKTKTERHLDEVKTVQISPNGKRALSAGGSSTNNEDYDLRLWDFETGAYLNTLSGHTDKTYVDFTPDSKMAVSISGDVSSKGEKTLRIWDGKSGRCIKVLKHQYDSPSYLHVSPDGKISVSTGHLLLKQNQDRIHIWDINKVTHLEALEGHTWVISQLRFTPDGRQVVSSQFLSVNPWVWDLETHRHLRILKCKTNEDSHTANTIQALVISPDGNIVISGSRDGLIRMWAIDTGESIKEYLGHSDHINSISVTPDGRNIISGSLDTTIRIWNIKDQNSTHTLLGHNTDVHTVRTTLDGETAVTGSDEILRVWHIKSGKCIAIICPDNNFQCLSEISVNGHFAIGTKAGEVIFLVPNNLPVAPSIITAVRLWLYRKHGDKGQWDENITSVCPWCGQRFPVSDSTLDIIRAINRNAGLTPDQSPCLELPDEAWDEPKLLSECPLCHKPLKYNPFIVDNKGRY